MEATINSGDTAWVLISKALVTLMTPALAFFYGGMVRRKNILSTLNLSLITMGLISLQWVLVGFTLAFGPSVGGFIGGLDYLGFAGVGSAPSDTYGTTLPFIAFAAYQMTFAVITPALITGSFVERVRFKTYIIFALLWSTLVYAPVAHWVWAAGGYCSVNTGQAPEANALLVGRDQAASAFDTASCIGCGACVASCRHASASLFVAAKLAHLGQLPQGQSERQRRALAMTERMAAEGFGSCSNQLECEAVCPKQISADWISWMNRELRR